jgi:hypothetical protein
MTNIRGEPPALAQAVKPLLMKRGRGDSTCTERMHAWQPQELLERVLLKWVVVLLYISPQATYCFCTSGSISQQVSLTAL